MPHINAPLAPPRGTSLWAATLLAVLLTGCVATDPTTGTWTQSDATTTLPVSLGGGQLEIDATVVLDGDAGTLDMTLALAALGLSDVIRAQGTYATDNADLTLTFTGFVIDPETGSTQEVGADGSQCILLAGFADTPVCFPAVQTRAYVVDEDSLTMTLAHSIAGDTESETALQLTLVSAAAVGE